ncbi:uncharacterized protein LOC114828372 [Galendromus occidentalis]|uniref:Uncharacterized protein LOC114828372 n=1 Tax=Galendromus occidentalis TaxID=34638 RepID=A0AAJ7WI91_9ACAR|nr:uncharacterized protein LOC114828372 [Galendromus occidentalis]
MHGFSPKILRAGGMNCNLCRLLVAVVVFMLACESRGFEHLKHKFKLKKLAKLALAAKVLVPHLIPLPIPFPIIGRHKHKESFKIIEEEDPWKGQGWDMNEGWDFGADAGQDKWNFEGTSGWHQVSGWQNQMAPPESWAPHQSLDGQFQKNSFPQESVPTLKGGQRDTFGSAGQHTHQVEIREEIIPALEAAGFFGDPNGVMTKMINGAKDGSSRGWKGAPSFRESKFTDSPRAHSTENYGWSSPEKTHFAEVHEVKEIRDATIVQRPQFDVENGKFGHFDVSDVPIQPIEGPRQRPPIDPWPQNVGGSPFDEPAVKNHFNAGEESNRARKEADHQTGFENVAPEDKLIIQEERHQAEDSRSHANISPDTPHAYSFPRTPNQHGWLPMVNQGRPPVERDAHKRS